MFVYVAGVAPEATIPLTAVLAEKAMLACPTAVLWALKLIVAGPVPEAKVSVPEASGAPVSVATINVAPVGNEALKV